MKFFAGAAIALVGGLLIGANLADAAVIDLSTWTCAKFQAADENEISVIMAWLDGFYRDEDEPPVIDTEKLAADADKLRQYCATHPDTGFIMAADEVFSK